MFAMSGSIVAIIVGGCLAVIGSLIVLNLRSIKHCLRKFDSRVDKQDAKLEKQDAKLDKFDDGIKAVQSNFSGCKVDCERTFVKAELFLRETGFTRRTLENLSASVNRLDGKFTVVEKLPQICGDIAREVVKEMKNREKQ